MFLERLMLTGAIVLSHNQTLKIPQGFSPDYSPGSWAEKDVFPTLEEFTKLAKDGSGNLRGVYAEDAFALWVVQQPKDDYLFISPLPNLATRFQRATEMGSIGLLAHNYLSGSKFSKVEIGQDIYLIYGNGKTRKFTVEEIEKYQALSPLDPGSDFIDLESGEKLSAYDVGQEMYEADGRLILQTCIEKDGNRQWGRLFVIAVPATSSPE